MNRLYEATSHRVTALALVALASLICTGARADRVHLQGGAVLEGKVSRAGDKVLVEVDSGTLSLDARSVLRVERTQSTFETFLERRAALGKGDIAGRLELASYCREHQMFARERELLREVLSIDTNHAQARARLGYVRGEHGWLTREEQLAARGLVKHGDAWVTPEQALRLQEAELERHRAMLDRAKAENELLAKRAELKAERERSERLAREQAAAAAAASSAWYSYPLYPLLPACGRNCSASAPPRPVQPIAPPAYAPPPNYAINGVRDPQSYFR